MSLFLFIAYFVKFIASIYWLVICCFVNCICDPHIRYKNRQKCYSKTQIYISISKIFQIKFASFPVIIFPSNHLPKDFICTVAYFTDYSSLVFSLFYGSQVYKSLSFVLGDTMYLSRIFSHVFTWFLSLCKSTNNTHMQIITFE